LPAPSSKTRSPASFSAAASTAGMPSSRSTPTSTRSPRSIAPTVSPATRTAALLTRWITSRMHVSPWFPRLYRLYGAAFATPRREAGTLAETGRRRAPTAAGVLGTASAAPTTQLYDVVP
jgi:hypothetical protein